MPESKPGGFSSWGTRCPLPASPERQGQSAKRGGGGSGASVACDEGGGWLHHLRAQSATVTCPQHLQGTVQPPQLPPVATSSPLSASREVLPRSNLSFYSCSSRLSIVQTAFPASLLLHRLRSLRGPSAPSPHGLCLRVSGFCGSLRSSCPKKDVLHVPRTVPSLSYSTLSLNSEFLNKKTFHLLSTY